MGWSYRRAHRRDIGTRVLKNLRKVGLYFHTLRFLRPVQIWGRILFRLRRPNPDLRKAPSQRPLEQDWILPAARTMSMLSPLRFKFLNVEGEIQKSEDWNSEAFTKLWLYNLHYFDCLNAEGAEERRDWQRAMIVRWIDDNPPTKGNGWEPYPASLRIVNWVKFGLSGAELSSHAKHSLAIQARWLTRRLERHILGNHLFANAKALMFTGLYFDGEEADRFRCEAWKIIDKQLSEQILNDGGQFELSPMYHALAIEDILDLLNLWSAYQSNLNKNELNLQARCRELVPSMLQWLKTMSHPDGKIAFFNDAAFGIAPANAELEMYAKRLGFSEARELDDITHLESSGYVRVQSASAVLIADVAKVGPDYLPGHAHADTLSFEFSLFGFRLFVNSGTSEYGLGPERRRQRGTAAHNTVTVASKNSSEVWAGFRVARRARVHDVNVSADECKFSVSGRHDGYRRISSGLDHWRSWELSSNTLLVTDELTQAVNASAFYHLHPSVKVEISGDGHGCFVLPEGERIAWCTDASNVRVIRSSWHPEFGEANPSQCLCLDLSSGMVKLQLDWS